MGRIDEKKMKRISGDARIGKHAVDAELMDLGMNYKKNVAKRYHLLQAEDMKERIREDEVYVSKKIDGQFSYLYKDNKDIFLFNYSGRVIDGIEVLKEEVPAALKTVKKAIFPCELYSPDEKTGRSRTFMGLPGPSRARCTVTSSDSHPK